MIEALMVDSIVQVLFYKRKAICLKSHEVCQLTSEYQ